jgi:AcrR family transcriptional regulator
MTALLEPDRRGDHELSTVERIRHAALMSFSAHGSAATTLRGVAAGAGVSLGLVQHHFATKAGLIKAVDDYVVALVVAAMSRVTRIIGHQPDVAGYVGRALVDGSALGATLFDALMDVGMARWRQRAERGETLPDVDLTWATINGLVLALGAVTLRAHVDRHLPQPLTTPVQLKRWQSATDSLLREGLFQPPGDD